MKIKAKITYKIDGNHPDIDDMPEKYWYDKVFTYEDTYTFSPGYTREEAILLIKNDLKLIAGGGYNYNHIYDVEFEIEEVRW